MAVSTFDLFKIGIGPSSSHTVGPMRAAARFVERWLVQEGNLEACSRIKAELFGSLALTGKGHGSDKAVLLGLEGQWPHRIDPDHIEPMLTRIRTEKTIRIAPDKSITFDEKTDLLFNKRQKLPFHSNGMRFTAFSADGSELANREYYSVGGGFVVNQDEAAQDRITADTSVQPYPFKSSLQMISQCEKHGITIILITHDLEDLGAHQPKLLYLENRVIFYGLWDEFCQFRSEADSHAGEYFRSAFCHRFPLKGDTR